MSWLPFLAAKPTTITQDATQIDDDNDDDDDEEREAEEKEERSDMEEVMKRG